MLMIRVTVIAFEVATQLMCPRHANLQTDGGTNGQTTAIEHCLVTCGVAVIIQAETPGMRKNMHEGKITRKWINLHTDY